MPPILLFERDAGRDVRFRGLLAPGSPRLSAEEELVAVYAHFRPDPVALEHFAAWLWVQSEPRVEAIDVTRPSRDGGRDAVGTYLIGPNSDPVRINFALEAKCYAPGSGVGVRWVSRLISRLKHREFGVFITTSHIAQQAYKEVREDQHPIVFITGRDIAEILKNRGLGTVEAVHTDLDDHHPVTVGAVSQDYRVDQAAPTNVAIEMSQSEKPKSEGSQTSVTG